MQMHLQSIEIEQINKMPLLSGWSPEYCDVSFSVLAAENDV